MMEIISLGILMAMMLTIGYIVGQETHKKIKREERLVNDKIMDDFAGTMMNLVLDANKYGLRLNISENREGLIVSCENLKTKELCSISKIEYGG